MTGRVEDSHAKLAAEWREEEQKALDAGQVVIAEYFGRGAARVEALGCVEEKKAAGCKGLETAWRCPGCGHLHTLKVVCGYDVESASKKEDANPDSAAGTGRG